jgi:hypothetical protein
LIDYLIDIYLNLPSPNKNQSTVMKRIMTYLFFSNPSRPISESLLSSLLLPAFPHAASPHRAASILPPRASLHHLRCPWQRIDVSAAVSILEFVQPRHSPLSRTPPLFDGVMGCLVVHRLPPAKVQAARTRRWPWPTPRRECPPCVGVHVQRGRQ